MKIKVLLVGLGSVGLRHIRLLKEIVDTQVICYRSGLKTDFNLKPAFNYSSFFSLEEAFKENVDFAIIANPTACHMDVALRLAESGIPFLIEKPVSHSEKGLNRLNTIINKKKLPVLVGFNLRYHPLFDRVKDCLKRNLIGREVSALFEVGEWLPYWRPQANYKKSYSAKKNLGGGVIFDLSHELDLAVQFMGKVDEVSCLSGKFSSLDIETEDVAEITLVHQNKKISHIHMDYLQKDYSRSCKIIGEEGEIIWNYAQGFLVLKQKGKALKRFLNPKGFHRDRMFKKQLKHWLLVLNGKAKPLVDIGQGIYVTKLAIAAHESAKKGRIVSV